MRIPQRRREDCAKGYNQGRGYRSGKRIDKTLISIAKKMLLKGTYSLKQITELTGLNMDKLPGLKAEEKFSLSMALRLMPDGLVLLSRGLCQVPK